MNGESNYLWCLFIMFFYTIELFLPLQILFYYQYFKNSKKAGLKEPAEQIKQ
jgi:hypothetical protein